MILLMISFEKQSGIGSDNFEQLCRKLIEKVIVYDERIVVELSRVLK